jgi:methylenetetrahydrofolate reductase (NADPH)
VRAAAKQWGGIADAVNVTDGARASVRMSALATVAIMRQEGVDAILQMTVRDRNRIALAADALGAAALGVRGFLALWGDPVKVGENPDAAEVRDLETAELIRLLAGIREGRLPGGRELDGPPPAYLVGSAASAGPAPVDGLVAKLDAGSDLVQTQIVLDGEGFAEWFGRCRDAGVAERATVLAGIAVPRSGEWIARMEKMGARASAELAERAEKGEGAEAVADLIEQLSKVEGLAGVHLMPLGSPPELIRDLADHARRAFGPN